MTTGTRLSLATPRSLSTGQGIEKQVGCCTPGGFQLKIQRRAGEVTLPHVQEPGSDLQDKHGGDCP